MEGIKVAIRIRPFNQRELKHGEPESCLINDHQSIQTRTAPIMQFNFGIMLPKQIMFLAIPPQTCKYIILLLKILLKRQLRV
jgi:hypothetical protein